MRDAWRGPLRNLRSFPSSGSRQGFRHSVRRFGPCAPIHKRVVFLRADFLGTKLGRDSPPSPCSALPRPFSLQVRRTRRPFAPSGLRLAPPWETLARSAARLPANRLPAAHVSNFFALRFPALLRDDVHRVRRGYPHREPMAGAQGRWRARNARVQPAPCITGGSAAVFPSTSRISSIATISRRRKVPWR